MTRIRAALSVVLLAATLTACSATLVRPESGVCHGADAATWLGAASNSLVILKYQPGKLYDVDGQGHAIPQALGVLPADSEAVLSFPDQERYAGADSGFAAVRDRSYVYDDALVALWLMKQHDGVGARRILQSLAALQRSDGAWGFSFAVRGDGFYNASYVRTGAVAWTVYAFARYAEQFRDGRFAATLERGAIWLLRQRDPACGLVLAGNGRWQDASHYDPAYLADFAATEHQIDTWFALMAASTADMALESRLHLKAAAADLGAAIERELWLDTVSRYAQGLTTAGPDTGSALDAAGTWSTLFALAAGKMEHASAALDWVQRKHPIHVAGWDGLRPYVGDPPGTWFVEGSLAMPLALARMGRRAEAQKALQPFVDLACSGGVPLVYSPVWAPDFPLSPATAPTVWFLFAGSEVVRGEPPFLWRERSP